MGDGNKPLYNNILGHWQHTCKDWNLYTLIDRSFNAIDVGYIQFSPLIHRPTASTWRQKYRVDLPADWIPSGTTPIVLLDAPPCSVTLQLLLIGEAAPTTSDTPLAAVINWESCWHRNRRSEYNQDALTPRATTPTPTASSSSSVGSSLGTLSSRDSSCSVP